VALSVPVAGPATSLRFRVKKSPEEKGIDDAAACVTPILHTDSTPRARMIWRFTMTSLD
jgi:hypothetical protein